MSAQSIAALVEAKYRPNDRLIEVFNGIVGAVRTVIEDLDVTEDEVHMGSRFLTEMAQQDFLFGFVDVCVGTAAADHHAKLRNIQMSNLEGPLYLAGAPLRPDGVIYEQAPAPEAKLLVVRGRVYESDTGAPVAGAKLDFWQTDHLGVYDRTGYNFRGIIETDAEGRYELHTVVPRVYTFHEDDLVSDFFALLGRHAYRSAHIHLKVWVDDREVLTTQFFDSQSEFLDSDFVVGAVRPELVVERTFIAGKSDGRDQYEMTFDVPVKLS